MSTDVRPSRRGFADFSAALQRSLTLSEIDNSFLDTSAGVLFARHAGLYRLDPGELTPVHIAARISRDFLDEYEADGRAGDPVLRYVIDHGRPIDSSRLADQQEWNECRIRYLLTTIDQFHSMQAPVIVSGMLMGTIDFCRERDDNQFGPADLTAAKMMGEQLGLALERAVRHEAVGERTGMLQEALDRIPYPVMITDLDARCIFTNRAAIRPRRLAPTIAETVSTRIEETTASFRRSGARLHTSTLDDATPGDQLTVKSVRLPGPADAVLTIVHHARQGATSRLPVWDVLTPREQEIAQFVSEGLSTRQIAERAFVTENTVKQHLKRMFAKTDARNRADLLQRIWAQAESREVGGGG